ncbi:MAG: transglutaminase domain-containing protein [Chloroflexi bacterium]|nr:transglutaminase domain-containing protein [Chloroflexota bacterium]
MEKSHARWWDLPSAIFLFFVIMSATSRLQYTEWTDGLNHVRNMAMFGLIVGLALGQSKFQRRGVIFLSIGYFIVLLIWQLFGMIEFGRSETYFGDKLMVLFGRFMLGLSEFSADRPVKDSLFFVTIFCIPYWIAALVSGYQLVRHANSLVAVLPSGILMFVIYFNHYTTHDYSWLFGLYIFGALLLLGRQKYLKDRIQWEERHVQVSEESGMDFNNTIMVSAAILIVVAWMIPSALTFNAQARSTWRTISDKIFPQNEGLDNMFAAAKKESQPVASEFYRDELALGTQAKQSESVAFLVYVPSTAFDLPRLYWRGRLYDRFENGRWQTTGVQSAGYEPQDGNFEIPDAQSGIEMSFTFNVFLKGQSILYSASQPLFVSHPANIIYNSIQVVAERQENTEELSALKDIVTLQAKPALEAGESYHTSAVISNPSIAELRTAGVEYPDWVMSRYLQLPDNFSTRIQSLAFDISSAYDNPYDQTAAITDYLRNEIAYAPTISFPDPNVDPLEYFLFDVKKGFCNYSASAEVLMLRSIGIPARLAVGFAQGEANLDNTFYTVREKDSHAWPEVYFPNYGWIEFEPTGNQSALTRPENKADLPAILLTPSAPEADPITQDQPTATDTPLFTRTQIILISISASGLILVILAFFLKRRFAPNTQAAMILKNVVERNGWGTPAWLNRWVRWSSLTPIERSFQSINNALKWMGKPQPVHATPTERTEILMGLLPSAAPAIEILLREHQAALFSPRSGDASLSRRAAGTVLYNTLTAQIKSFVFGIQLEK